MKILITGISGFVARHFVEMLPGINRNFTIAGIYNNTYPQFNDHPFENVNCIFHKVDMCNGASVKQILEDFKPGYILHLASQSSVSKSWLRPAETILQNTTMFLNLVEQVRNLNFPCRILSVGSTEEYGNLFSNMPLSETNCPHPVSPYGAARMMQQKLVEIYSKNYGLHIVHTRSFNHMGPYQSDEFVISSFTKQIATQLKNGNKYVKLRVGNIKIMRDFTDVRDVVKAYFELLLKGKSGETYNVCSNKGYILKDIIFMLEELTGTHIHPNVDVHVFRPSENDIKIGSYEKIKSQIGWEPVIPIEQTLVDMLEYWNAKL